MTKLKKFIIPLSLLVYTDAYPNSTLKEIGNYTQVIVPSYAFGMAANENDYEGIKQFTYSFSSMQLTVLGLKSVINEPRPDKSNKNSFPSGHTASAFSGATFIHKRYGFKRAIVPYVMAGFTGYTRIEADKHWFHDVVAGALISSMFTWIFVSPYDGVQASVSLDDVKLRFTTNF